MEENRKVLLSVKDLVVKFRVRGRILTAIRGISLDIYENESIAIVGESGSGKSVFTKTFAGKHDSNGFIDNGSIVFDDDELAHTEAKKTKYALRQISSITEKLNSCSPLENASPIWRQIVAKEGEMKRRMLLSDAEYESYEERIKDLNFRKTELFNYKQTLDPSSEKAKIKETQAQISALEKEISNVENEKKLALKNRKNEALSDRQGSEALEKEISELKSKWKAALSDKVGESVKERNALIAKEIYLSIARYDARHRAILKRRLLKDIKESMKVGADLYDEGVRSTVFDSSTLRVRYEGEDGEKLWGKCVLNLTKIRYSKDWNQIRGGKIATVFQDPMTSLNPIITIGKQITSIILKHQNCSEAEARRQALTLMKKVGIPNAENRYDDYPFQYSGGMRQRIVIAIALSCRPKILICDEPTTALDVTIQAQILKLIKDLQKEFGYTIVFITHDLGVVANIADRVAVLYAGQIVELGEVEEVFYDPRHPYTWALLSSLPQLAEKNTKLYSISGTPPSLYNKIVGDPFAPRNPYCLKIDTLKEPPMFAVTETHFAKTWLLDPRAGKVEKPDTIRDIHQKLINAFNIGDDGCE